MGPEIGPALEVPEVTHDDVPAPETVDGALEKIKKEEEKEKNRIDEIERNQRGWLN